MARSAPTAETYRRRRAAAALALLAVAAVAAFLAVALSGGGTSGAADGGGGARGAAAVLPADALAYVDVSLDRHAAGGRAGAGGTRAVSRTSRSSRATAMDTAGRDPGRRARRGRHPRRRAMAGRRRRRSRCSTRRPSTAGSLIVVDGVRPRPRPVVPALGGASPQPAATAARALLGLPNGSELAFAARLPRDRPGRERAKRRSTSPPAPPRRWPPAPRTGARPRAHRTARVLDAYASAAGVRRVLADQGGILGAVGDLLYQPALQGVAIVAGADPGGRADPDPQRA